MTINYAGSDSWVENVRIKALTDPVTGGLNGAANVGLQDLADRTVNLKATQVQRFRESVEAVSGGRMTIMVDALGEWHLMVAIPAFNPESFDENLGPGPELYGQCFHPAFSRMSTAGEAGACNVRLWVAAVPVRILDDSPARYGSQPAGSAGEFYGNLKMTLANARTYAASLGQGWHVVNAAEWGALGLLSRRRTLRQRGNVNSGTSELGNTDVFPYAFERANLVDENVLIEAMPTGATLPGSGPDSWRHDGSPFGVSDLVGNQNEWVDGIYSNNGKLYLYPMNWPYDGSGNIEIDEADFTDTGLYWGKDGLSQLRLQLTGTTDNTEYSKSFAWLELSGATGSESIFSTAVLPQLLLWHGWHSTGKISTLLRGTGGGVNNFDISTDLIAILNSYLSPSGINETGLPGRVTEKLEAAKHYYVRGGEAQDGEDAGFGTMKYQSTSATNAFRLAYIENIE